MRRSAVSLLIILPLAAPVFATDEMILVYPGKPGTQEQAKNVLESFTDYVETHAGWGKGALHATYFNSEDGALEALNAEKKPEWGILSLAIYVKWKKEGKAITLVAQSELEKKPTMQFHLLVPKDSKVKDLATLSGARVASSYLEDRQFATKVLFKGAVDAASGISVIDTKTIGTALTYCANFRMPRDGKRIDALLVDDEQLHGLEGKKADFAKMRLVWSSDPLPTPPVVRFGPANAAKEQKLLSVLTGMNGNAPGKKILDDLTTTGFQNPNKNAYDAVEKLY